MDQQKPPSSEQLLAVLEALITTAPKFTYQESLTEKDLKWLGRADAAIEASNAISALVEFRTARKFLNTYQHDSQKLLIPLHDAYSRIELNVPSSQQGAFIPAGDTWNGYAAIIKLVQRNCQEILIVDPYINSDIFTFFAPHTTPKKGLKVLTTKKQYHSGIIAASEKWLADPISEKHPTEVKYAPDGSLHDRLIIIDNSEVWLISQSLKDIAKKSPASVTRADTELARIKAQHYKVQWTSAIAIK